MNPEQQWEQWRTMRARQDELWLASTPAAQPRHPEPRPPLDLLKKLATPVTSGH